MTHIYLPNRRWFFSPATLLSLLFLFSTSISAQSSGEQLTLPFAVYLEAECGEVGENWETNADETASGESYVVIKPGFSSLSEAPDDIPENRVRFTVNVQQENRYHLWGRVLSSSGAEDSYWVRINDGEWVKWFNRLRYRNEWTWREVIESPFLIPEGVATIDFAFREPNTKLDKVYLSSLRQSPNGTKTSAINCDEETDCTAYPEACADEAWIEGECGTLGAAWSYTVDTETSNSGYLTPTGPNLLTEPGDDAEGDRVVFETEVSQAGDYYLDFLMNTPDKGKNSFWVRVDDGEWINFSNELGGADLLTDGFEWRQVNVGGNATSFNLNSGSHTITVVKRESGTKLDKIHLGRSAELPTGFGKFALNCQENSTTPTRPSLDLIASLDIFPNPVKHSLNFNLNAPTRGAVSVNLVDITGRNIRQMSYVKTSEILADELDVANLPMGYYRLLIVSVDGVVSRPFIRQ
ncbi:hypothetical protein GGR28_000873 [Lewinella aquimaris]|uniref:Secretion system C-terminal sorting domain-containing protein n=1 Tax=Neolewinella aquimaris TaxID=1835722 RepID=A0A840E3F7_9BACT|nr:T9SS type A sorting domain-containing protein [Neolewinella aquimaris]MBB4078272.1 hypothetical protein [Neolewinella aquimaris]